MTSVILAFTIVNFGNIGGDKTLFEHIDHQLRFIIGIKPYKKRDWVPVLKEKFKAARQTAAKLSFHHSNHFPFCQPF